MCLVQNFSGLKGVFPGRIKRSSNRRESESSGQDDVRQPSKLGEPAAERAASRNSSVHVAGTKSVELSADAPPQVRLGDQSYQESRLRKFNAIISKNFVDLTALEEVRCPSSCAMST